MEAHRAESGGREWIRWLSLIVLGALAGLATGALALGSESELRDEDRYIVDTDALGEERFQDGLDAAEGQIRHEDETFGYAALHLEDPRAFEGQTGVELTRDPVPQVAYETAVAAAPDDTYAGTQWGMAEMNMPQAWTFDPDQPEAMVAILDTGIDAGHVDLPSQHIVEGSDYVESDETPQDTDGHGTFVAGVIAGVRDNARGIAGVTNAELYVTRVLDGDGDGSCYAVALSITEAVEAGADVVNVSLRCPASGWIEDAVNHAWEEGVLVVSSSGNAQATDPDACVTYPAAYANAIAVGATDPTLTPAAYSCQGPEVELAAPGTGVFSTTVDDAYMVGSGTSAAAPHVAGAVALVTAAQPTWPHTYVRETLQETARDLGEPGRDEVYGYGMVDPVAALTGAPVYATTDVDAPDEEVSDPAGLACVNPGGDAECEHVAASGTGDATTGDLGFASLSGTGDATACETFVGDGNFQILPTCLAASGTGDATGSALGATGTGDARADCVALSGGGQARSDCNLFGIEGQISGCETGETWSGSSVLCLDPQER